VGGRAAQASRACSIAACASTSTAWLRAARRCRWRASRVVSLIAEFSLDLEVLEASKRHAIALTEAFSVVRVL